jgi:hypothetical protein
VRDCLRYGTRQNRYPETTDGIDGDSPRTAAGALLWLSGAEV